MPAKAINEEEFLNLLISPISARIVAGGFVRALKGDVWVLGRDAARKQQGKCQKSEFHGPKILLRFHKCSLFSRAVKISGKNHGEFFGKVENHQYPAA